MNANDTRTQKVDEQLEERDRRALEQYLTVLPDYDRAKAADDLFMVVSESGSEYLCDVRVGACECPDHEYRDVHCKHLRRVGFATGEREVPTGADVDVDPQLDEHVGTVATDSGEAHAVATDGGVTVREAAGDCEVTRTDDKWDGPHAEFDRYGNPTGTYYKRCNDCSVEVLDDTPESAVSHRDGCRFGGDH